MLQNQRLEYHPRDHLHIRGENDTSVTFKPVSDRITSTYVEKIAHKPDVIRSGRDHLHIRGENETIDESNILKLGSPPHTWRKFL